MTYCAAIRLKTGIVFASDTRTNAGIDHISTFKKLFTFGQQGHCFFTIQTAGNLATSQAVISLINNDINEDNERSIYRQNTLFDIANLIGEHATNVAKESERRAVHTGNNFTSSFLIGGQIAGEAPELFLVYGDGNCLHATRDTPFLQIGESKYGKPILDRVINYDNTIDKAIHALLVSFDATIRSNLSVGYPIDLLVYQNDSLAQPTGVRLDTDSVYLNQVRQTWSDGLLGLLDNLDHPPSDYYT
ncbi:peptidase [Ostreibacterium oceani]|uniref:Peptidase n=1 Tax=Ostreibacterium oceani TaxID=2654998 RepID=A0A6N7ETQ3_9GAMM|nr:peptidase [Ostreibacterium oceani]MPV86194.1 peptidase [Ostreibacterium oceani]